jgi:hypothetical protein
VEDPFLNVTVPVGAGPVYVMVAVKVTVCPHADGFAEEVTVVVESFFTTWDSVPELLARKYVDPRKSAVIE